MEIFFSKNITLSRGDCPSKVSVQVRMELVKEAAKRCRVILEELKRGTFKMGAVHITATALTLQIAW